MAAAWTLLVKRKMKEHPPRPSRSLSRSFTPEIILPDIPEYLGTLTTILGIVHMYVLDSDHCEHYKYDNDT